MRRMLGACEERLANGSGQPAKWTCSAGLRRFSADAAPPAGYRSLYGAAASRNPSPTKLNASTVTITRVTDTISHG